MQIHRSIDQLPPFKNAVITIGTFDGVHQGHKKLINALKEEAKLVGGQSIIITFHPHPRKILNPSEPLQLINSLEEKMMLLSETGIDHVVIVPFTHAFAEQTAEAYMENFLLNKFHPHTIIIGYDHHFGKDRKGNFHFLKEKALQYHFRLMEIPKYIVDEIDVSSTKIRNALLNSKLDKANKLLGYAFFFEGTVVTGDQLGREIGYPTANIRYDDPDKIHLGHGVYAVAVQIDQISLKGMLSIGTRPTLKNSDEKIEVNIFDWAEDIYGRNISISVKKYLRPQEKYNSMEALKEQLKIDKINSLKFL